MLRSATRTTATAAGRASRGVVIGAASLLIMALAIAAGLYIGLTLFYLYLWLAV